MQHLRKFNETKLELDVQYFEECFIEFLDNTKENKQNYTDNRIDEYGYTWKHQGDEQWHIQIFFPENKAEEVRLIDTTFMEKVVDLNDKIGEVYKDIDVAIKKIKIKYPESDFLFEFTNRKNGYITPMSIGIFVYGSRNKVKKDHTNYFEYD